VLQASGYMGIILLDHLIISENGFYSYADEGKI
jgi:DNA repair protein RadC